MPADEHYCQWVCTSHCGQFRSTRSVVQQNEEWIMPTVRFVHCQAAQERWVNRLQQDFGYPMPKMYASPDLALPGRWQDFALPNRRQDFALPDRRQDFALPNRRQDFASIVEQRSLCQNSVTRSFLLQRAQYVQGVPLF